QYAHHSVQQGMKLAAAGGAKTAVFAHNNPADLERCLRKVRPYRVAVVAVDGIYSMTGTQPPLAEFREIAERHDAVLYVDDAHRGRLDANMTRFLAGMRATGVPVVGGAGAIASVVIGSELATLRAGKALFDRGYYAQSVVFPAVPHHAGLLRVQVNANHRPEAIDGLVAALAAIVPTAAVTEAHIRNVG